jgi:hypothetical protein
MQVLGIDFTKTFSMVVKMFSIWILLALTTEYDYEVHQMNVKIAFLNGYLKEEIYMR